MKRFYLFYLVSLLLGLSQTNAWAQFEVKVSIEGTPNSLSRERSEREASQLLTAFSNDITGAVRLKKALKETTILPETQKEILKLWNSSAMLCSVSEIHEQAIQHVNGGFQIRNIPISMLAADDDDQDLVLQFNQEGALVNVSVAIETHNYNQVILKGHSVDDMTQRQIILDFVENFRTAYNRKDWDYLNMVYSNDALIITGREIKKKEKDYGNAMLSSLGAQKFEYQVQSKAQYMEKLKGIFKKNKCINIKFEEVTVARHPKRNKIYGVTLKQHWNTSTYSDVGYLFLMINFENGLNPTIEVRTWQPDKFEGREIARSEVFSFKNFDL